MRGARWAHREEGTSELLEFLILVPILLAIALLIWQMFIFGHAMVVTANSAREGARAAAACEGSVAAGKEMARRAALGYQITPKIERGPREVKATIYTHVPMLRIPYLLPNARPVEIHATARMRREWGPRCP